jgi:predicted DNA-binding transcriptional regulator AlpA
MTAALVSDPSSPTAPAKLLLDVCEVAALLGLGERTVWKFVSNGTFPRPDVKIGTKIRKWRPATIAAWVNQQAERGGQS